MASTTETASTGMSAVTPTAPHMKSSWATTVLAQGGPWDEVNDPLPLTGVPSLPMPVVISDKESLAPFFAHLRNGGRHTSTGDGQAGTEPYYNTELLEFEKGVLYADHRMDLCKMAVGPRSIGDLMDSLKTNAFTKHFLLGNNIIGPVGAAAIASFLTDRPQQMETWYLAGNCIDHAGLDLLVNAMTQSPVITNVWLKRNPLGPGAAPQLVKLITQSPALRTLDLDQTELGDQGIAQLFDGLVAYAAPVALRHIYLNATGFGPLAAQALSSYLASPHCQLESLYLSSNPLGDAVASLAPGLEASTSIQRLSLQSCGLKDAGTVPMLKALIGHPSLKVLDIAQSYSTKDLSMRYNWLTCPQVIAKLVEADTLQYLDISFNAMSQAQLVQILPAVHQTKNMLFFNCRPLVKGGRSYAEVKASQEYKRMMKQMDQHLDETVLRQLGLSNDAFEAGPLRFLLSPEDVRHIDSVYRNRDAAIARRRLKQLQKGWDEDDKTLQRVQDGEVA